MFRNILVCVDASPQGEQALEQAVDLADCERSRLTILVAVCRPPCWATTPMTAAGIEPLAAELEEEARQTMCRAVERVPDCVPVTKILTSEPIRRALAAQLRTGRHDLVVLGAPAPGTRLGAWRGRVSRSLVRRCDVPVLLVHPDGVAESRTELLDGRRRASAPLRAGASG